MQKEPRWGFADRGGIPAFSGSGGSEIAGGAQNIHAERIHFKGTDNGIRIKANRDRGADVSNISFKDIVQATPTEQARVFEFGSRSSSVSLAMAWIGTTSNAVRTWSLGRAKDRPSLASGS